MHSRGNYEIVLCNLFPKGIEETEEISIIYILKTFNTSKHGHISISFIVHF